MAGVQAWQWTCPIMNVVVYTTSASLPPGWGQVNGDTLCQSGQVILANRVLAAAPTPLTTTQALAPASNAELTAAGYSTVTVPGAPTVTATPGVNGAYTLSWGADTHANTWVVSTGGTVLDVIAGSVLTVSVTPPTGTTIYSVKGVTWNRESGTAGTVSITV